VQLRFEVGLQVGGADEGHFAYFTSVEEIKGLENKTKQLKSK